jgi:hypothetical protein
MEAKDYCGKVNTELTSLKARAYDIIRHIEKSPKKDELSPQFTELNALVDDLSVTIDKLSNECPIEFDAEKDAIEKKKIALLAKIDWWDQEHFPGGYAGG